MIRCYGHMCYGLHTPVPGGQHTFYTWAHASCCRLCHRAGYLCMDKCTLKKAIETQKQLSHNNRKHLNDGPVVTSQTIASFEYEDDMNDAISLLDVPTVTLHSHALQLFLTKSIDKGMIMAIRNLVCGACFGARLLPLEVIHSVQLHDTYVVLLLARLVFCIGSVHQVLLRTLLSVFVISRPQKGPSALPIT